MHRFVWDLHYPPPDALRRGYPIAAIYQDTPRDPLGPWVLPGQYTVKLTAGGKTSTQPLTVEDGPARQDFLPRISRDSSSSRRKSARRCTKTSRRFRKSGHCAPNSKLKGGRREDAAAGPHRRA